MIYRQYPVMISLTERSALRLIQCQFRRSGQFSKQQHSAYARLVNTLAILEQREGKLNNASLSAVTAAQKIGATTTGFIAGSGVKSIAEEAAKVKGLNKIIMVENGSYDKVGRFKV